MRVKSIIFFCFALKWLPSSWPYSKNLNFLENKKKMNSVLYTKFSHRPNSGLRIELKLHHLFFYIKGVLSFVMSTRIAKHKYNKKKCNNITQNFSLTFHNFLLLCFKNLISIMQSKIETKNKIPKSLQTWEHSIRFTKGFQKLWLLKGGKIQTNKIAKKLHSCKL